MSTGVNSLITIKDEGLGVVADKRIAYACVTGTPPEEYEAFVDLVFGTGISTSTYNVAAVRTLGVYRAGEVPSLPSVLVNSVVLGRPIISPFEDHDCEISTGFDYFRLSNALEIGLENGQPDFMIAAFEAEVQKTMGGAIVARVPFYVVLCTPEFIKARQQIADAPGDPSATLW